MSRISLHRPRRRRAVRDRPATDTRLLPTPHSRLDHSLGWGIPLALSKIRHGGSGVEACPEPRRRGSQERNGRGLLFSPTHLNPHYKRCPKALRLRLRSDQSPSRPLHGRSPDKSRHALSKDHCQVRAPLIRRLGFAPSGDALEHSVMSPPRAIVPPWAIAPPSDSPGLDLAGESEQSDERRLKTNAPFLDSTVVTTGELPTTNAGHGSPLPSLGMVEHFWWSRLPHSETSSRLLHILSEVRGCRRVVADVKRPQGRTPRIATGVADILRKRPGPSITSPFSLPFRGSARNLGLARSPISALSTPSPRGACPPEADHSQLTSGCKRTVRLGTVHLKRSVNPYCGGGPLTLRHSKGRAGAAPHCQPVAILLRYHWPLITPSSPIPIGSQMLQDVNPSPPTPEKTKFPRKQSKTTTAPAHQSKLPLPTSNKGAARPLDPTIF